MKTRANQGTKSGLGTNVRSSGLAVSDKLVTRFNELNAAIVHGLPEMARSYETLHRHLPLLREMQGLLSQRPKHAVGAGFTMLDRTARKTVRIAMPIGNSDQLPTWTQWITAYAAAIDYSVRQIRRLVLGEARMRTTKECGWSYSDHNRLIAAATAGYDLVNAIEAGVDTTRLCQEIKQIMRSIPEDVIDREYEPMRVPRRKRPARRVTRDAEEF
ncbi:MAG: hypothetical protein ABSG77_16330 [Candidatus Acidiferrum sp.]